MDKPQNTESAIKRVQAFLEARRRVTSVAYSYDIATIQTGRDTPPVSLAQADVETVLALLLMGESTVNLENYRLAEQLAELDYNERQAVYAEAERQAALYTDPED